LDRIPENLRNYEGFSGGGTPGHNRYREWQATVRANLNNGAYTDDDIVDEFIQRLVTPLNIYKNFSIPAGVYHFDRRQLTFYSPQDRRITYNVYEQFGGYYGGKLNVFRLGATYRPNAKCSISASQAWNRFRLPIGNFSVNLANLQMNYSFNRFLTLSSTVQTDTANTQAVSANFRLRYTYRPDSDLYIIYNVGTQFASLAAANPQEIRETRFAVKYTYSFSPEFRGAPASAKRNASNWPHPNSGSALRQE
jgi:hypothetical protein